MVHKRWAMSPRPHPGPNPCPHPHPLPHPISSRTHRCSSRTNKTTESRKVSDCRKFFCGSRPHVFFKDRLKIGWDIDSGSWSVFYFLGRMQGSSYISNQYSTNCMSQLHHSCFIGHKRNLDNHLANRSVTDQWADGPANQRSDTIELPARTQKINLLSFSLKRFSGSGPRFLASHA